VGQFETGGSDGVDVKCRYVLQVGLASRPPRHLIGSRVGRSAMAPTGNRERPWNRGWGYGALPGSIVLGLSSDPP